MVDHVPLLARAPVWEISILPQTALHVRLVTNLLLVARAMWYAVFLLLY